MQGETIKNVSEAVKDETESDENRSAWYNENIGGKNARKHSSVELSEQNVVNVVEGKVEEVEERLLGFSEKERRDGFKRTSPKDYPYALMIYALGRVSGQLCSGSLITASWVLTAAHCLTDYTRVVLVYAGGSSMKELNEYLGTNLLRTSAQIRLSDNFHKHPRYADEIDFEFDVAVVKVREKFKITATVSTVSLYERKWGDDSYRTCVLTAFGRVFRENKDPEDNTRKTHYLEVRRGCPCDRRPVIEDNLMCSRPKDDYGICTGDSGGGLVCGGRVVAVAKAILTVKDVDSCNLKEADTEECGTKNTLSVFQDIKPYLEWINSKINIARIISSNCPLVLIGASALVVVMY